IYESTVYPGVTEDLCGPLIERTSGLKRGTDFFLAYSPERVNPGDREHTVERILKGVAGESEEVTDRVAAIYDRVTSAGTFRAKSIMTAEAAKVIENAQRDINIAFMNEITQIFAKLGLSVLDVLDAAGTKWNFLRFQPGLVGGHCIGVDPYYLSHKARKLGYGSQVILAGRNINDDMANYVARKIIQHIIRYNGDVKTSKVLIKGATFKENVSDIRNSKVADMVKELKSFYINVDVEDPYADSDQLVHEYGFGLSKDVSNGYDAVIITV